MSLHALLQSCQRRASLQRHNIKALLYIRPISRSPVTRTFCQSRSLASRIKSKSFAKAAPYNSKVAAYESAAGKLARLSEPVLLYQAHNNLPFIIGCYSVGAFLITCAIINNYAKHAAVAADVPTWVKVGVIAGQFTMVVYGGYMCLKVCVLAE